MAVERSLETAPYYLLRILMEILRKDSFWNIEMPKEPRAPLFPFVTGQKLQLKSLNQKFSLKFLLF